MKINYMGKEIYRSPEGKFSSVKSRIIKFTKKLMIVVVVSIGLAGFGYGSYIAGGHLNPKISYAEKIVEVQVESLAPVMDRIARCESNSSHYRNGQVLIMPNKNGTTDVGYYQINSIWNKKATEMGLDLTKEEDNKKFGMYLYKTMGTEPWVFSKTCWNK